MATANTRKSSAVGAAAKKPRSAGGARAAKPRAGAAATAADSASSTLPAAKTKAVRAAKSAAKPAAKAKKPAPAKKLDAAKKVAAARKPAAKKPAARKARHAGEAEVVKKPAAAKKAGAAKAPATATAPRTAKARPASRPQAPAVLSVASMQVDTSLAAQVAARAVLHQARKHATPRGGSSGASLPLAAGAPAPRRQSTLLRELRESVTKPPSHQLDNLLSGGGAPKGQGQPFGRQPTGRGQAGERKFEPHAGYYGVPRRAAG